MTASGKIKNWFSTNKHTLLGLLAWAVIAAAGGFVTAMVPVSPADNRLVDLAIAGTILLNIVVIYFSFVGAARLVFKPSEGFFGSARFTVRKDMLTTLVGVLTFVIVLVSIPPLATQGNWHIPVGGVGAIAFLGSWLVVSFSMKRVYSVQFFEEVLSSKERDEYQERLASKPKKANKSGMFLVDLGASVRGGMNRFTGVEKSRTHKLIFAPIQALLVLLSPSLLLFWTLWVLTLSVYTTVSATAAPVVMVLAASVWAVWHIRGGFTRVVARRKGRVMESVKG